MSQVIAGVSGVNRVVKKIPLGVSGVKRDCKEAWAGVNGVNRRVFNSSVSCKAWSYSTGETQVLAINSGNTMDFQLFKGSSGYSIYLYLLFTEELTFKGTDDFTVKARYPSGNGIRAFYRFEIGNNLTNSYNFKTNTTVDNTFSFKKQLSGKEITICFISSADYSDGTAHLYLDSGALTLYPIEYPNGIPFKFSAKYSGPGEVETGELELETY